MGLIVSDDVSVPQDVVASVNAGMDAVADAVMDGVITGVIAGVNAEVIVGVANRVPAYIFSSLAKRWLLALFPSRLRCGSI